MSAGLLYLIPTPIAEGNSTSGEIVAAIRACDYFVVENVRTARRYISSLKLGIVIDELEFVELSEHTLSGDVSSMLQPILKGRCGAIMSEAGLPCVADPGSLLVEAAHRAGVKVVPLIGASSIMLALMASGFSGQNFAFNGYLPIKADERSRALRRYEQRTLSEGQTQIFIETPYRNLSLFGDLLKVLSPSTRLAIACDITSAEEYIKALSVEQWRKTPTPPIAKRPAIFLIAKF